MQVSKEIWTWGEDQKMQIHRMQKGNQKDQHEKGKKKSTIKPSYSRNYNYESRVEWKGKQI